MKFITKAGTAVAVVAAFAAFAPLASAEDTTFEVSVKDHQFQPAEFKAAAGAAIVFKVKNVPGALFKSLSVFALRDISLSKIESRPMRGRPWEYVFYVDFLRGDDEPARNALRHLGEVAEFVKVLGIYSAA